MLMSNEITDIKDDMVHEIIEQKMVSVPEDVLQSLIWNCELATAGMGTGEALVGRQVRELQRYISAGQPVPEDEEEICFLTGYENVEFVNFKKR